MLEYEGREQSLVKHFILRKYLERFAHIIFSWKTGITYVDCFSGPWNVRAEDLSDSSFAIAIQELRKARDTWIAKRPNIRIRCFFLEKDRTAYSQLASFAAQACDAEVHTKNAKLEDSVTDILNFVDRGGAGSFPFFLIDPTGWTGFELDVIEPLLKRTPGEVLVNLMTSFVRRFIKSPDPETQRSFERTFGPYRPSLAALQGLSEQDLDDAIVEAYSNLVGETGRFAYVCNAIVLHPDIDSTHFRLVYGTRHLKGVEVFKQAEQAAMPVQEDVRARLRGKRTETEGGLLFSPESMGRPQHYQGLRERYLRLSRRVTAESINSQAELPYDSVYALALKCPLVWEADLREWLADWRDHIAIVGLKARQRVPRHSQGVRVVRRSLIPGQHAERE